MRVAVIPARGGSKRIPRKNIKPFCGKPMLAWPIAVAQASGCFDRILVSTDDAEIAEVARRHGAEAPFVRPAELANDHAGTLPVIAHAVQWQREHGKPASEVCCIYPTAAFVEAGDLRRGLELLREPDCDYAFSVTRYASAIQRALRLNRAGRMEMFDPAQFNARSQDLEEAYYDAGQFYWGRAEAWLAQRPIFGPRSAPVVLPRHRAQDIDTPEDWMLAEWLFKAQHAEP